MSDLSTLEINMVQWVAPLFFLLGVFGAALVVLAFNLRTNQFVREIQRLENKEGRTWPFWSERRRLLAFLFRPDALIDDMDGQQVVVAKQALIAHRRTVVKRFLQAGGILLIGTLSAIAIPVLIGLLHATAN